MTRMEDSQGFWAVEAGLSASTIFSKTVLMDYRSLDCALACQAYPIEVFCDGLIFSYVKDVVYVSEAMTVDNSASPLWFDDGYCSSNLSTRLVVPPSKTQESSRTRLLQSPAHHEKGAIRVDPYRH
jgi:hypothetical protein